MAQVTEPAGGWRGSGREGDALYAISKMVSAIAIDWFCLWCCKDATPLSNVKRRRVRTQVRVQGTAKCNKASNGDVRPRLKLLLPNPESRPSLLARGAAASHVLHLSRQTHHKHLSLSPLARRASASRPNHGFAMVSMGVVSHLPTLCTFGDLGYYMPLLQPYYYYCIC